MKQLQSLTLAALLASAAVICSGGAAHAQFSGGSIVGNGFQPPVKGGGVVPNNALPPPPALPGAAQHTAPAPPSKQALDIPPTEALFDAIDRGDLAGARDALSRGADLSGRNVLGMTPIESSIDLGRNDITFLLLSMRGGASDRATAAAGPPAPMSGKARAGSRMAEAGPGMLRANPTRATATVRAVRSAQPPPLPPAGVRYAGANPGSAVPQAGFLGFGGQ